jgi:hypothetical protein
MERGEERGEMIKTLQRILEVLLALFLFLAHPFSQVFSEEPGFRDLNWDYWAFKEIQFLREEGIISGYPDGTFKPENPITRAEFAKLILLYSQPRGGKFPKNPTFPDVPSNHWAFPYVEECAKSGLVSGYPDGTFRPENYITKAEMVKLIVLSRKLPENLYKKDAFLDCREGEWFYPYVQTALSFGILRVSDPGLTEGVFKEKGSNLREILGYNFFPNKAATRAQAAVLLYRLIFVP